jgi:chromosome segregation ATPase
VTQCDPRTRAQTPTPQTPSQVSAVRCQVEEATERMEVVQRALDSAESRAAAAESLASEVEARCAELDETNATLHVELQACACAHAHTHTKLNHSLTHTLLT